ncbi:MAG TPA: hypothetical protein VFZ09_25875 [Archangium sp.]|uniref:hypothetical protein n=1 Tax=Archangium sp. TaxID=1872627 RepID=UPI002E3700DA|nr:hypothetical protein [Archangium sp.]HEX5749686.1 hypothetical protein [Archangium sp.]
MLTSSLKTLSGAPAMLCAFVLASSTPALAQDWSYTYAPTTQAQVTNPYWGPQAMNSGINFYPNIWGPKNTARSTSDLGTPLRMSFQIQSRATASWSVDFQANGRLSSSSPAAFFDANGNYINPSYIKAYPHNKSTHGIYVWEGGTKNFRSTWDHGMSSTNWSAASYNVMWELRLSDMNNANPYIVQIEILRSNHGNDGTPDTLIDGRYWKKGSFTTYGSTPVYTFTMQNSEISANTRRTVAVNFMPFLQHLTNIGTPRTTWNHKVDDVNAGIEVIRGEPGTKFTTYSYGIGIWDK